MRGELISPHAEGGQHRKEINVTLTEQQLRAIGNIQQTTGNCRSAIIRAAIHEYVLNHAVEGP